MLITMPISASVEEDRRAVAELDLAYQAAVKHNDAGTMRRILHEDFVLVLGNGEVATRDELLQEALAGTYTYEKQDEDEGTQTVRVWGDTAVVTARLWIKGAVDGKKFDRRLWFSDTYVRAPDGWKYVFGQASLPLPDAHATAAAQATQSEARRVVEIRSYLLVPGTRERFHRLFVDQSLPLLQRWGIDVVAYGPSIHDEDSYVLMRSYTDLREREESEEAFYASKDWRDGPREAVLDCIESYATVVLPFDADKIASLAEPP
jgi:ketosteroid isomerase-like protein